MIKTLVNNLISCFSDPDKETDPMLAESHMNRLRSLRSKLEQQPADSSEEKINLLTRARSGYLGLAQDQDTAPLPR